MQRTRGAWFLFPASLVVVNAAAELAYSGAYVRSHGLPSGYVPASPAYAIGWVVSGAVVALVWPTLIASLCSALSRVQPKPSIIMGAIAGALTFVLTQGVVAIQFPTLINLYAIQVSTFASASIVVICYALLRNVHKPYSTSN